MKRTLTLHINSGVCVCGCLWDSHHLSMIVNIHAYNALPKGYPPYVPEECCRYGCNEYGGMKYNPETEEYEDHCHGYRDKDGPKGDVEWDDQCAET